MTKDEELELRKAFIFENFKKLLYFVNCCAGEGLQLGKVCADELLYRDILAEVSEDVLETIEKREHLGKIPEFMKQALTGREQELIRLRYGLFGEEVHTQKEVGALFGISRSYVSRMEKKALKKLRQCYEAQ